MTVGSWMAMTIAGLCLLGASVGAMAQPDSAGEEPSSAIAFAVYPEAVRLDRADDVQRLVVVGTSGDGLTRDVTGEATLVSSDGAVVAVEGDTVRAAGDGAAMVTVSVGGATLAVPVEVGGSGVLPPASFGLDVIPAFTSAGCNAGKCHGSARGQDGFRLSLFGFDPQGDYHRVTREIPGRRVDTAFPESSLLLRKPLGDAPHTGGTLFDPDDPRHRAILRWIAEGARPDPPDVATVTGISLFPPEFVASGPLEELRLVVTAAYSDGTDRDVTDLAVVRSNNEVSAEVLPGGLVRSGSRGEAFVTASFGSFTTGIPCIVLDEGGPFTYHDPAATIWPANYIDGHIESKLRKLRMNPSELCTDGEFVRRVHLDIAGVLPTPEELSAFLADDDPRKRSRLIDALLERKEFSEIWVMYWAELLQIRSNNEISEKAAILYFDWVRNAIAANMPVDQMVREILTSTGGTFSVPGTNFYQAERDTLVLSENVAQAFMGVKIQCAQCHNHPFDRWTQDDYYGFAAFFSQIGRKQAEDPRETIVFDSRSGEVRHPVNNRVMAPTFLGGATPDISGRDRREVLAEWLASPENPLFARSLANRVWSHFMGRGLVEPVDDFRVSNPPSNGPLLDSLGERLAGYGFDFKLLVRDICNSRAYQRSTRANATNRDDERNFARARPRRLRAEVLLDVICQATEVPEKLRGLPLGERAVRIADGTISNYFLTTFGRSTRESVDACEVSLEPSLSQALHLINGDTVSDRVARSPLIADRLASGAEPLEVATLLYRTCLSRSPTAVEIEAFGASMEGQDAATALQDLFWALLNSQEFVFNH